MDSSMKMVAVYLLVLWDLAQGYQNDCRYEAVGVSITIPLRGNSGSCNENSLTWKFNSNEIFRRRKGTVHSGKPSDVTDDGSLRLVAQGKHKSGEYKAEQYDNDGRLCGHATENLCIIERVSTPHVTYTCTKNTLTVTCNTKESKIKWSINGDIIEGESNKSLHLTPARGDKYSCTAWNEVSEEKSSDLMIRCQAQLSFTVIRQNYNVKEGEDVSMLCNSTPPADKYTITKPRSTDIMPPDKVGTFTLRKVTKEDAGVYTCRPEWTPAGPYDNASATVELHVISKDKWVRSGTENTLFLTAHSILFLCLSGLVV